MIARMLMLIALPVVLGCASTRTPYPPYPTTYSPSQQPNYPAPATTYPPQTNPYPASQQPCGPAPALATTYSPQTGPPCYQPAPEQEHHPVCEFFQHAALFVALPFIFIFGGPLP